jgi:hypothetical protein
MKRLIYACVMIFCVQAAFGQQKLKFSGQLSAWGIMNTQNNFDGQLGGRYLPKLTFKSDTVAGGQIAAEVSANLVGSLGIPSLDNINDNGKISPYRAWIKYERKQFEVRAGLQKINFGSANMIRPLMWFDELDPTDPLKLTNGVYSILFRYYFLNNANIWIWGLYGNDKVRGLDAEESISTVPEYGGRFQFPVPKGELAFSAHHRTKDGELILGQNGKHIQENKVGVDGKWDLKVGFWLETSYSNSRYSKDMIQDLMLYNVGLDYTFPLGTGLNVATEFFYLDNRFRKIEQTVNAAYSTIQMSYPLGLFDNVGFMAYYDWNNENIYSFVNWQRTYDHITLHVLAYWNPEIFAIPGQEEMNLFGGKGAQIMLVWNH